MIKITEESLIKLHKKLQELSGGDNGVRDFGLISSAVSAPFQTFGGVELYPTITEKGARLGYSLIKNHAFIDGNKRIGILATLVFLEVNGVKIRPTVNEVIKMGLSVASSQTSYEDYLNWINSLI